MSGDSRVIISLEHDDEEARDGKQEGPEREGGGNDETDHLDAAECWRWSVVG